MYIYGVMCNLKVLNYDLEFWVSCFFLYIFLKVIWKFMQNKKREYIKKFH